MSSRLTISDIESMMQHLKIKETDGTDQLSKAIVDEILKPPFIP